MGNTNTEEIDLFFLFKKLNDFFKRCIILFFRVLNFVFKNWIVILSLIILGLILGYFAQKDQKTPKESHILLRINFDAGQYVYNSIDVLEKKIKESDTSFFKQNNLPLSLFNITKLEIEPIVDFSDIVKRYESENFNDYKNFETLFKNIDLDGDITPTKTFETQYKYHNLDIVTLENTSIEVVDQLLDYLNSGAIIKDLKEVSIKNLDTRIKQNENTISQINNLLTSYTNSGATVNTASSPILIDKDLTGVIEIKNLIQKENEYLYREGVLSKDLTIMMNKPHLLKAKLGLRSNKLILYPIGLVLLFLLIAWIHYLFIKFKKMAEEEEAKLLIEN